MKSVLVNVKTLVNKANIREEVRDGRKVIVVSSATMPDDVIMNGVLYPAAEIEKAYKTLEGTLAPLGHPMANGKHVSATDPAGIIKGFVGAYNTNVRREGGRVLIDKVIDVEYASQLTNGKRVLEAIEKGEPIHTSTGVYAQLANNADKAKSAKHVASNLFFDHDAILLDEAGAATPDQGVGMMVNAAADRDGQTVDLINSAIEEAERELDWIAESAFRVSERIAKAPYIERIKTAIKEAITGAINPVTVNQEDTPMDKAQMDELTGKIAESVSASVSTAMQGLGEVLGTQITNALKPLTETMQANAAKAEAEAKAKHEALVNSAVTAGVLTKELAEATPAATLEALLANHKQPSGVAYRVNGAAPIQTNAKGGAAAYAVPEGI